MADIRLAMTYILNVLVTQQRPPDYVLARKTSPNPGPALSFQVWVDGHRERVSSAV